MTTADLANEMRAQKERARDIEPAEESGHAPLFPGNEVETMRTRWQEIQGQFVDDPRNSVQAADELVASTIHRLAEVFADEKSRMEQTWSRGDNVNTEDLRQAFRRYRSFFDRLLSA